MDYRRHYLIIYNKKIGTETLQDSYVKFCTFKELIEAMGTLYKDPFVTSVRYHEITEAA